MRPLGGCGLLGHGASRSLAEHRQVRGWRSSDVAGEDPLGPGRRRDPAVRPGAMPSDADALGQQLAVV
ncbi:MAG: hypothetical protein WKF43_16630, partial [Acidimicrobiales bacterium]